MSNDTKDRILKAALEIFSRDGYTGANLKEIAGAVGVVKSGFYRHYTSKEELWNAVLDEMERYYAERFGSAEHMPAVPQSTDELKTLTLRMLDFTMHDEKIIMTRKILLTEQFRDARVRALATKHFGAGLEAIFTKIFAGMMENGSMGRGDPSMLAFAYTAPIMALVHYRDREPEKEPEILQQVEAFVKHFVSVYGLQSFGGTMNGKEMQFRLVDAGSRKGEYIDLFQVYCDELSKDDPTISRYDYTELARENLEKSTDRPMFIMTAETVVGFVVFMEETEDVGEDDCHTYIGEIYVKPEYRNQGIASRIVCSYLDSLEYDSGFCYIRNSCAEKFWIRLLDSRGYRYDIVKEDEVRDFVHVHLRNR